MGTREYPGKFIVSGATDSCLITDTFQDRFQPYGTAEGSVDI
jgi:hypothetical protein